MGRRGAVGNTEAMRAHRALALIKASDGWVIFKEKPRETMVNHIPIPQVPLSEPKKMFGSQILDPYPWVSFVGVSFFFLKLCHWHFFGHLEITSLG